MSFVSVLCFGTKFGNKIFLKFLNKAVKYNISVKIIQSSFCSSTH